MARDVVFLDGLADDFFRHSVAVDIRRIPGIQPSVVSSLQQRERFVLFRDPFLPSLISNAHSTKDGHGHSQTALAELPVLRFWDFGRHGAQGAFNEVLSIWELTDTALGLVVEARRRDAGELGDSST